MVLGIRTLLNKQERVKCILKRKTINQKVTIRIAANCDLFICCFVCAADYFFDFLSYLPPSLASASARVILPLLQSAMV